MILMLILFYYHIPVIGTSILILHIEPIMSQIVPFNEHI